VLLLAAVAVGVLALTAPAVEAQDADAREEVVDLRTEPTETSVRAGETEQFRAIAEFEGGLQARVAEGVEWSSGDEDVATIDDEGFATGQRSGTAEITAEYEGQFASATLDVVEVTDLEIRPAEPAIDPGASQAFSVVAEFAGDVRMDVTDLATWESGDTDIVAFDEDDPGLATGQRGGSTDITAEYAGETATTTVEAAEIAGLEVQPAELSLEPDESERLEATAELARGETVDVSRVVEWSSENDEIATIVGDRGLVRGEVRGTVDIIAQIGEHRDAAEVTVEQPLFTWANELVNRHGIDWQWVDTLVRWLTRNVGWLFDAIQWPIAQALNGLIGLLNWLPWYVVVLGIGLITWWRLRDWRLTIGFMAAMVLLGFLAEEIWSFGMQTLAMILVAVIVCTVIGIPIGIWAAKNDQVWGTVRPILDAMQTIHPFIYLIPIVFFFGIGPVPGTIATIVFALPPVVRLTNLGIRQVPGETVEAARAFGSTDRQTLFDVQLPLARPAIMQGVNQSLMLAYSMVVIAAMVAAGGLGQLIFRAVQRNDIPSAMSSGLGVLILAIILDRLSQSQQPAAASEE
jgi:glycine betaine/proline transport system permease protein